MKIRILTIGKIKEAYLKQGILEYLNRLKPYSQIELLEVNDESIIDNPHHSEIKKAIDIEGERLLKLIKPNEYVISLDINKTTINITVAMMLKNNSKSTYPFPLVRRFPYLL